MNFITLSAKDPLIHAARADAEHSLANEQFGCGLGSCAQRHERLVRYETVMGELHGQLKAGRKPNRESMNER